MINQRPAVQMELPTCSFAMVTAFLPVVGSELFLQRPAVEAGG